MKSNQKQLNIQGFILPLVLVIIVAVFVLVSYSYLKSKDTYKQNVASISPMATQPDQKEFENETYSFRVITPRDISEPTPLYYSENEENGYYQFKAASGCFTLSVAPENIQSKMVGLLVLNKRSILDSLKTGDAKTFDSPEPFNGGNDFVFQYTYSKVADVPISASRWKTFVVTNNWENHGTSTMYYFSHNSYLYVIRTLESGPCPDTQALDVLSTFEFLN